jgi:hypothetical protein
MEDVLDLYERPYDPEYPQICFDERPCQLLGDTIAPLPMKPGQPRKEDYTYKRQGTCCVLLAVEPLSGWRMIRVYRRRTKREYALFMRELSQHYPQARSSRLVQDNLNTHSPASFYETFAPVEARSLTQRFELHYTPKKARWLNMAEIELSVLSRRCLHRRLATQKLLTREVRAYEHERNRRRATIQWRFTTSKARRTLACHYDNVHHPS